MQEHDSPHPPQRDLDRKRNTRVKTTDAEGRAPTRWDPDGCAVVVKRFVQQIDLWQMRSVYSTMSTFGPVGNTLNSASMSYTYA